MLPEPLLHKYSTKVFVMPMLSRVISAVVVTLVCLWFTTAFYQSRYTPASTYSSFESIAKDNSAKVESKNLLDDIQNNTLGFSKVFSLNLPSRTDRRDRLALAAAATPFHIEFIPGVLGEEVSEKALPNEGNLGQENKGAIGCWRAHMNAMYRVVRENLTSALILEDDVDWDIRLKSQLRDVAVSTNALQVQRRKNPNKVGYLDFRDIPEDLEPQVTPYGDDWDLIWLGYCRGVVGRPESHNELVTIHDDVTVPQPQHLNPDPIDEFRKFPNHTRVVFRASSVLCAQGYAVSQRGARSLLHSIGLWKSEGAWDSALKMWCAGSHGYRRHKCYAVRPKVFDLAMFIPGMPFDTNIRETPPTGGAKHTIRHSVIRNLETLLDGNRTCTDGYPDS